MTPIARNLAVALALIAGPLAAETPPVPDSGARGALDGAVFEAVIEVEGYDAPFTDRITFAAGQFYSEECQRACDFGWSAYHTRAAGTATEFVVDTACSDAPQSVRWEGRVVGDRIEGRAVWTVERFYWTVERRATFAGRLVAADARQAALPGE